MTRAGGTLRASARRLAEVLRSRRLAVALLLFTLAWSFAATVVPQSASEPARTASWAAANPAAEAVVRPLGMHAAFTTPAFLAAVVFLAASTAMCSIERTRWALRASRPATAGEAVRRRLAERPDVALEGEGEEASVRAALTRAGMRVREDAGVLVADGRRASLLGSPLFHWALAGLFLVVGAGQLTRSEALTGVAVGDRIPLVRANYGGYTEGALYRPGASRLEIGVPEFTRLYTEGGVARGASPRVQLYRDGALVADQRVYPNQPLRYGAMLIHQDEYGVSPRVSILGAAGQLVGTMSPLSDWSDAATLGVTPAEITAATGDPTAPPLDVTLGLVAARDGRQLIRAIPPAKRVQVSWTIRGSGVVSQTVLVPGERVAVPGGFVRLDDVRYYSRLKVADDWSVLPMYVLFGVACAGLALTLVSSRRTAWVEVEGDGSGRVRVRAVVRQGRADPMALERVEDALRTAVAGDAEPR